MLLDPSNPDHEALLPQLARVHMDCIEIDKTMATFLPPLDHHKVTKWWEGLAKEIGHGGREIIVQLVDAQEGLSPRKEVAGVVMLKRELETETGPFRGEVLKLLVSPKHRQKGIARRIMAKLEETAKRTGTTLLVRRGYPRDL